MSDNLELPNLKEIVQLRVELEFQSKKNNKLFLKKTIEPVQGDSVDVYLKVTNISNKVFLGARIENFYFKFKAHNLQTKFCKDIQLSSINPGESLLQKVDWTTFNVDGVFWASLEFKSDNQDIQTYQYDKSHKQDEEFDLNNWGVSYYLEGKLATLQTKTNNIILLLTCITVWEAIFGIKDTLKLSLSLIADFFVLLSQLFDAASKFT